MELTSLTKFLKKLGVWQGSEYTSKTSQNLIKISIETKPIKQDHVKGLHDKDNRTITKKMSLSFHCCVFGISHLVRTQNVPKN